MKGWEAFSGHISFRVGDGSRIKFWVHKWCGENELRETFPNLYRVSCLRDMTVQQIFRSHGGVLHWDLRFRRNLQDWEMEEFHNLVELLYGLDTPNNVSDVWRWRESKNRLSTVKSYYKRLLVREEQVFPHTLFGFQSTKKGVFHCVVGGEGSDFVSGKSKKEKDNLC